MQRGYDEAVQLVEAAEDSLAGAAGFGHAGTKLRVAARRDSCDSQFGNLVRRDAGGSDCEGKAPASTVQQGPVGCRGGKVGADETDRVIVAANQFGAAAHAYGQVVSCSGWSESGDVDVVHVVDRLRLEADLSGCDVVAQGRHRGAGEQMGQQHCPVEVLEHGAAATGRVGGGPSNRSPAAHSPTRAVRTIQQHTSGVATRRRR